MRFHSVFRPGLLLALSALWLAACASGSTRADNDGGAPCTDKNDCRPGYECVAGQCVLPQDGGLQDGTITGHPLIQVTPSSLVFDQATVGQPQVLSVMVENVGDGNLILGSIEIQEDDATVEFSYQEPTHTVLGPNDSIEIQVTLAPVDSERDTGVLVINSNDEVNPEVTVTLSSSWIGSALLDVCVMSGDPAPNQCTGALVVDFGTVPYAGSAESTVMFVNSGTGNKVINIQDMLVETAESSHDALYQLEIFQKVEQPPGSGTYVETPATLPVSIAPSDGVDPDPLALYARVTFTANTDGFLVLTGDSLKATTTDTDNPNTPVDTQIPFAAAIDGCPPGTYDLNGDQGDGCEYACSVTNGGVEACDGIDNDCDGNIDGITEPCYDAGDGGCNTDGTGCQGICQAGTKTCTDGTWSSCSGMVTAEPEQCNELDDDCNGQVNDGLDQVGNACGPSATTLANRPEDSTSQSVQGTITPGDVDWYKVTFQDTGGYPDNFNADIQFTSPPGGGDLRFDIYQSNCAAATGSLCSSGQPTGLTHFAWNASGELPGCSGGANPCGDNTMTLYIKVYSTGSSACETYTIRFRNG